MKWRVVIGKPAFVTSSPCVVIRRRVYRTNRTQAVYRHASDLVAGLRSVGDFEISVAAYPEVHPSASSPIADLENLKRKLDAGATRAITQYFFDTTTYLRFLDLCLAAGITAPIVPGIMPVSNYAQAVKFSNMCGAGVPNWMGQLFEGTENDPETRRMVGMMIAAEQVRLLQANGVDEFHFYTLNRPDLDLCDRSCAWGPGR